MHSTIRITKGADYGDGPPVVAIAVAAPVLDAAYNTVHLHPSRVAGLAARVVGMSESTLDKKINRNNTTHHLSLAEAVALQVVSGDAAILHAMAKVLGYTCTPELPDQSGGDPVDAFMLQAVAYGRFCAAAADALRSDCPSRNEVNRVGAAQEDLTDAAGSVFAILRGRMRKAPGGAA